MASQRIEDLPAWEKLKEFVDLMDRPDHHLFHLIRTEGRFQKFSLEGGGIFYDFSRQRVDPSVMENLFALARGRGIKDRFSAMMRGEKVNATENRAALHTACRDFSGASISVDGADVMPEIGRVREEIREFSGKVHSGEIRGATGKRFSHAVVVGIGGSYLGSRFVSEALAADADKGIELHYLANVDINDFGRIAARIDPEATLWIIISKSYTTPETLANTEQAYSFMREKGIDPAGHVVTVTAKGSPGDDPSNPVLKAFHMFDFIGGRYSVSSAVGGVPLSLYLGYDRFEGFLKGAEEMDLHTRDAAQEKNLPLIAALIGIWNNNFLGYSAQSIIPYSTPLNQLAPHIQQLYMESNGKSVTEEGEGLEADSGVIIFGEPGTNAQHSFFQLAHQGRPFPIDFIGVLRPQYKGKAAMSKGVTNHQELWANLISQPLALAQGKADENPAKVFGGNRPSSTIVLEDLSPENVGRLLSFYEARTVYEAFVWGINPFDQYGVELGKILAGDIRKKMAQANESGDAGFEGLDPIRKFYLKRLYAARL